eukprot:scaffold14826_cov179-Alexandrium_tamarense.AAC.3
MGKAHSGKTSMRSIIFANYLARDTMRLSPTLDVEHHHVRFLGDLVLNLWDCGGQDAFYESYFERDRETIFRSVELLIYVFDIESDCPEKDFDHFAGVLEALEENSPDARIFVLVHKMDLVAEEERELILEDRRRLIEESCVGVGVQERMKKPEFKAYHAQAKSDAREIDDTQQGLITGGDDGSVASGGKDDDAGDGIASTLAGTNMEGGEDGTADETHSNSSPIHNQTGERGATSPQPPMSPGGKTDNKQSAKPANQLSAPSPIPQFDAHRFEKISNIVKQFKLSCGKAQSQFQGMDVRNSRFTAFIDAFTANTYIMVIVSNTAQNSQEWGRGVQKAATLLNIQKARSHFEQFIPRS